MLRIALFLGLGMSMVGAVSVPLEHTVLTNGAALPNVQTVAEDQEGTDREGKAGKTFNLLPSIISMITFNNDPCTGPTGAMGICYSQKECKNLGSTADGTCANGYGVCCIVPSSDVTCGGTLTESGASFIPPSSPYNMAGTCVATLDPPEGTCQIKLDFNTFDLAGPIDGECSNDTFVVTGNNPGTEIPVICGENGGQHMYIDIDNSDGPFQLITTTSGVDVDRDWDVEVTYLAANDECAPQRCLQYYTETSGSISSFASDLILNNQKYAICFANVKGYCDIGLDFDRFDLGPINGVCNTGDFLGIGTEKICGDFVDFTAQANSTAGPTVLTVMTDDDGDIQPEGFTGTYTMMGC